MDDKEEIFGQEIAWQSINNGIRQDRLSQSLLFYGPSSSGKMTSAINLAKLLNCESDENRPCNKCRNCTLIGRFNHPDFMLINTDKTFGKLSILYESIVEVPASNLIKLYTRFSREAIYKISSTILLTKDDKEKIKKTVYEKMQEICNQVNDLCAGIENMDFDTSQENLNRIKSIHKNIEDFNDSADFKVFTKSENIPIDAIREMNRFLNRTPYSAKVKVVIVNDIFNMRVEAVNAFLKNLEEPPKHNQIILITENFNHVLPTIRSRCYNLRFKGLTINEKIGIVEDMLGVKDFINKNEVMLQPAKEILSYLSSSSDQQKLYDLVNIYFVDIMDKYHRPFVLSNFVKKITESGINSQELFALFEQFITEVHRLKSGINPSAASQFIPSYISKFAHLPERVISETSNLIKTVKKAVSINNVSVNLALESVFIRMSQLSSMISHKYNRA